MKRVVLLGCLLVVSLCGTSALAEWHAMGSGMSWQFGGRVAALAVYHGQLVAAGQFTHADGNPASNIARWDGSSWQSLGNGLDGDVWALTVWNDKLVAGGSFAAPGNRIAAWNGSSWQPLGGGIEGAYVLGLSVYHGELLAGGWFSRAGEVPVRNIARWNGARWDSLGSGTDGYVWPLTVYDDQLIAGGRFTDAGHVAVNCVAAWDGTSWESLGSGVGDGHLDNTLHAMTVNDQWLVGGGLFAEAGGVSALCIAQWDGFSWSSLGSGADPLVRALASHYGLLFAGGDFVSAGDVPANHIARWDGTTWSALGSGTNDLVFAIASYGGDIIVGGEFSQAGGIVAHCIARWDGDSVGACCQQDGTCSVTLEELCPAPGVWQGPGTVCDPNACFIGACCHLTYCDRMSQPQCVGYGGVYMGNGTLCEPNPCVSGVEDATQVTSLSLSTTPNPSTGLVMIRYTLPKPAAVTIEVFDAAGGLVRRLAEDQRPAGAFSTPWDGRDDNGRDLPTGVYYARIATGEGATSGQVVIAR